MARRREIGTGPRVEESVDMVMEMGGMRRLHHRAGMCKGTIPEKCQVFGIWLSCKRRLGRQLN